jgi:hypothetical protein
MIEAAALVPLELSTYAPGITRRPRRFSKAFPLAKCTHVKATAAVTQAIGKVQIARRFKYSRIVTAHSPGYLFIGSPKPRPQ